MSGLQGRCRDLLSGPSVGLEERTGVVMSHDPSPKILRLNETGALCILLCAEKFPDNLRSFDARALYFVGETWRSSVPNAFYCTQYTESEKRVANVANSLQNFRLVEKKNRSRRKKIRSPSNIHFFKEFGLEKKTVTIVHFYTQRVNVEMLLQFCPS